MPCTHCGVSKIWVSTKRRCAMNRLEQGKSAAVQQVDKESGGGLGTERYKDETRLCKPRIPGHQHQPLLTNSRRVHVNRSHSCAGNTEFGLHDQYFVTTIIVNSRPPSSTTRSRRQTKISMSQSQTISVTNDHWTISAQRSAAVSTAV